MVDIWVTTLWIQSTKHSKNATNDYTETRHTISTTKEDGDFNSPTSFANRWTGEIRIREHWRSIGLNIIREHIVQCLQGREYTHNNYKD